MTLLAPEIAHAALGRALSARRRLGRALCRGAHGFAVVARRRPRRAPAERPRGRGVDQGREGRRDLLRSRRRAGRAGPARARRLRVAGAAPGGARTRSHRRRRARRPAYEVRGAPRGRAGRAQGRAPARLRRDGPGRGRRGRAGERELRGGKARGRDLQLGRLRRRATTVRVCGWACRSWRGATTAWRPGRRPAAATRGSRSSPTGPRTIAESAARKAITALDAVDAPAGRMPVVVGQRLRRRAAARGDRSRPRGRRGAEAGERLRRAAWATSSRRTSSSPTTTAACRASGGATAIDDEGTPTQRTTIIEGRQAHLIPLRQPAGTRRARHCRPATGGASRSATCRSRG